MITQITQISMVEIIVRGSNNGIILLDSFCDNVKDDLIHETPHFVFLKILISIIFYI